MKYIKTYSDISIKDVASVGAKNAALGEMKSGLSRAGLKIPDGFATTADAYRYFLEANNLAPRIREALGNIDPRNISELAHAGANIRNFVRHATLPKEVAAEISVAYREFCSQHAANAIVAVRGSPTAVDIPGVAFTGQQESCLNIRGIENLIEACKRVYASLFTDRAIVYREEMGIDHFDVALSLGIQKLVRADQAVSGVMYTLEPETGFRDIVYICASYGLGENIAQGRLNPDEYYVCKSVVTASTRPIIRKLLGDKALKMVCTGEQSAGIATRNIPTTGSERQAFALDDDDIIRLARSAMLIEKYFSAKYNRDLSMDIEWAKDGATGELLIVQARPEGGASSRPQNDENRTFDVTSAPAPIGTGKRVGTGVAVGHARVITDPAALNELKPGDILVTDTTDGNWESALKLASAVITDHGHRNSHTAIAARKLGIPAIIGTRNATQIIRSGQMLSVACVAGDSGQIYNGKQAFTMTTDNNAALPQPQTHIMLNLAHPEQAFELSSLPVDGVGLARLEYIIRDTIRVHPRAILEYDKLDADLQERIKPLLQGYANAQEYYIQKLAEGIATIAAAFFPRPVIVRYSDFKSDEYASLIGGDLFEPDEENPLIGWRGAGRYCNDDFNACFALECIALRRVRETMGLTNVAVMLPFARTPKEASKVLDFMATQGLVRGEKGLQVFLMCEIPSNALLADQFLDHFDGFSIGTNDLTQLAMGVDRESKLLEDFDERDPAVLTLMEMAIDACNRRQKYIGICGDAPSRYPEITRWLVQQGIKSISLNPESITQMIRIVAQEEEQSGP